MITVPSYKIGRRHAMRLNCTSEHIGPCGKCDSCVQTAKGMSLDVLELRGDLLGTPADIERFKECLVFRPARERYRVCLCTPAMYDVIGSLPAHESTVFIVVQP